MYKSILKKQLVYNSKRYFGVLPKLPKAELTVRTPYREIFANHSGYTRLYVWSIDGLLAIGNKSNPRVYLLPPGEMEVKGVEKGEGNKSTSEDGKFIHTGGWLFVHDNNSVEVNLIDCAEKSEFDFDTLQAPQDLETESDVGKVASQLQEKTYKTLLRHR